MDCLVVWRVPAGGYPLAGARRRVPASGYPPAGSCESQPFVWNVLNLIVGLVSTYFIAASTIKLDILCNSFANFLCSGPAGARQQVLAGARPSDPIVAFATVNYCR